MSPRSDNQDEFEKQVCDLMSKGDGRAVEMLYDRYADALFGIAMKILGDESAAKDVIQDAFVKMWNSAAEFDPSRSKVFTWLYSIVRNTAIDKLRKVQNRRDREIQTEVSNVSPMTSTSIKQDTIDIPKHLDSLDEKYKEVVIALFFKGLTQREASERLDLPLGTIKSRLRIALRELRNIYTDRR